MPKRREPTIYECPKCKATVGVYLTTVQVTHACPKAPRHEHRVMKRTAT